MPVAVESSVIKLGAVSNNLKSSSVLDYIKAFRITGGSNPRAPSSFNSGALRTNHRRWRPGAAFDLGGRIVVVFSTKANRHRCPRRWMG